MLDLILELRLQGFDKMATNIATNDFSKKRSIKWSLVHGVNVDIDRCIINGIVFLLELIVEVSYATIPDKLA